MSNITFANNMRAWSRPEPIAPVDTYIAGVDLQEVPKDDELNFDIMLSNSKSLLKNALSSLNECYNLKACKEIHDAQIHLTMALNALNNVK